MSPEETRRTKQYSNFKQDPTALVKKIPMQRVINLNKNLPIFAFRDEIMGTIKNNPVVILQAETGAGKSTQVPQYLLEAGYTTVVTQPRRLAAASVSERVAEEVGCKFGTTVGYRTAYERCDSAQTKCLFVTDGLALIREIMGSNSCDVLVIDEVHEWNLNIEVLVAWCRKQVLENPTFKVVIMSATLEAEKLSAYFGGAPVINVPGRTFPVETREATLTYRPLTNVSGVFGYVRNACEDVVKLVNEGRNVLVFMPGKGEIASTIDLLKASKLDVEIMPLHGELTSQEQKKCFQHFARPKVVVSTNVAQTSITIDDIDAVVDSELEKRIELTDNVEGLHLRTISLADSKQRKGRAGRTKPGVYIGHSENESQREFPTAEILRTLLDQTVLRLAMAGFDAEDLEFFHQPDRSAIHQAKDVLKALDCLDAGGVTKIGRKVAGMPCDVRAGRMLVEADRLGVVNDVVTLVSILECDGLLNTQKEGRYYKYPWQQLTGEERESDLFAHWNALKIADGLLKDREHGVNRDQAVNQIRDKGIRVKAYFQIKEMRSKLIDSLRGKVRQTGSSGKREAIIKAIVAGMVDQVWKNGSNGVQSRQHAQECVVSDGLVLVVGQPKDISGVGRRGKFFIQLLTFVTRVTPEVLMELAPHLASIKVERPYWSSQQKAVVVDHVTMFNTTVEIAREAKQAEWSEEAFRIFVGQMQSTYSGSDVVSELYRANTEVLKQYEQYYVRSNGAIKQLDSKIISDLYSKVLESHHVLGFGQLENLLEKEISKEDLRITLSQLISQEEIVSIETENSSVIEIDGEEFSVAYSQSYGKTIAKIEVAEKFIFETKLEAVKFPNGRELQISCGGYTQSLGEHRARMQSNLVSNFKNQINGLLAIPREQPFHSGWSATDLGSALQSRFNNLQNEMIEGLTLENLSEKVEMVKTKAEEIKTEISAEYEKAQGFITSTEESFEKTLAEVEQEFVQTEVGEIRNLFAQAKTSLQKGEFVEVNNHCREIEIVITSLKTVADQRKAERDELIKKSNVPENLLSVFRGDLDRTLQFISNVEKIETFRLDSHEITCGRARASQNMGEAWSAMGEESDFFCGADANDVKYYVYEYHFGNESENSGNEEETDSFSGSGNSDLAEKLRQALGGK